MRSPLSHPFREELKKVESKVLSNAYVSLNDFKKEITEILENGLGQDPFHKAMGKELSKSSEKQSNRLSSMNSRPLGGNLYQSYLRAHLKGLVKAGHANPGAVEAPVFEEWRGGFAAHHIIPAEVVRDLILKNNPRNEHEYYGALFNAEWNGIMLRSTGRRSLIPLEDHQDYAIFTPVHTHGGKPCHCEYSKQVAQYIENHHMYKAVKNIPFELGHVEIYKKICGELKAHISLDPRPLDEHEIL